MYTSYVLAFSDGSIHGGLFLDSIHEETGDEAIFKMISPSFTNCVCYVPPQIVS